MAARFELGRVVATPGAQEALEASCVSPAELLERHQSGDWGNVSAEDAKENERSVRDGFRILSSYSAGSVRIWIITEADRTSTCLLLPEEY